jgi:hypothetical protein
MAGTQCVRIEGAPLTCAGSGSLKVSVTVARRAPLSRSAAVSPPSAKKQNFSGSRKYSRKSDRPVSGPSGSGASAWSARVP